MAVELTDLMAELREDLKGEEDSLVDLKPTGVDVYDIYSGGGLPKGGFVEFVGNPGSGKTTLALQILGKMLDQYPDAIIVVFDAERSITQNRLSSLGVKRENTVLVQRGITVEKIFLKIESIFRLKDKKKIKDRPTFILWDSIAFTPAEKELEVADMNSAIGVKAKVLNSLLRKYDEQLLDYNTTLIAINQLNSKVALQPQYAKTVTIKGLGDRVPPGGNGQLYAAFHFLALDKKTDLTGSEFGFKGYIAKGEFIKNKSGLPFEEFLFVMDYKHGVNLFWTKFLYLKEAKIFKVTGGWYTLEGYTEEGSDKLKKFRGSAVLDKYNKEPKFKEIFDHYWDALATKMKETISNFDEIDDSQLIVEETPEAE